MAGLFSRLSQRVLAPEATVQPVSSDLPTASADFLQTVASLGDIDVSAGPSAMHPATRPITAARREYVDAANDPAPLARVTRSLQLQSATGVPAKLGPPAAGIPDDPPTPALRPGVRTRQIEREPPQPADGQVSAPDAVTPRLETPPRERTLAARRDPTHSVRTPQSPRLASPVAHDRSVADAAQSPVINVTIDRIDVHQPPPPRASQAPAAASRISLGDYLSGAKRRLP